MTTTRILLIAGLLFALGFVAGLATEPATIRFYDGQTTSSSWSTISIRSGLNLGAWARGLQVGATLAVPVIAAWIARPRRFWLWVAIFAAMTFTLTTMMILLNREAMHSDEFHMIVLPIFGPITLSGQALPQVAIDLPGILMPLLSALVLRYLNEPTRPAPPPLPE